MEHLLEKGEYESLDKYLKQFVSEELGEVRSIYSDSPIINAVFHNKMSICKEKGIDISCNITGSVKCLDDMGVGSILFNLLDNAIEACEKNKKEKRIVCQIAREADEVNIFLENSIDQSVLAENPSFETTKDKDVYQYGIEVLISTAINIMLLLVIGIITKTVLLSICHFLILATIRTLTGGYHASTYLRCEILGCVTYITIVLCLEKVTQIFCVSNWLIVCSLMGIITLINFAITNKRTVIDKELKRLKKKVILRELTWIMLVLLLEDKRIKGGILLSFFAVFLFTIIDKIKNERKDKKSNIEKNNYTGRTSSF